MQDIEKTNFSSLEEKCQYYKSEYETYKVKFTIINKEYKQLAENNIQLYENINKERKLRKNLEEKLKYSNVTNNDIGNDLKKIKREDILWNDFILFQKDIDNEEEKLFNINSDIINKSNEIVKIINFSILSKNKIGNSIIENSKQNNSEKELNVINRENLNKSKKENKNQNNNFSISNKSNKELAIEEVLTKDFLLYSKESISLSNSIFEKESKIDKIYSYIQKFCKYLKLLKNGAFCFNESITLFIKNLSIDNTDNKNAVESFPSLTEYISIIQKSFSTINIYCSSLIMTIDSSCMLQINDIIIKQLENLYILRDKLNNKKDEFKYIQNDFLSNKNHKSMKNNYYKEYGDYELLKYDYFSSINKLLLLIKLKLPEIMSLLTSSYFAYFSAVRDELNEINNKVRKNLEKLFGAVSIKNKIETDIKIYRTKIVENIKLFDKTKKDKEGFLYLKEKDSYKFNKRYVKIYKGSLIFYKLKKDFNPNFQRLDNKTFNNIIDQVDTGTIFEISKLIFSNVKKCEKNYFYPFCFEVNSANTKNSYIFQAETEYEMEEWISSITNAISGQISDFSENKNAEDNKYKDLNNNIFIDENDEALLEMKNKNLIQSLIENNRCADCGAENPTWLNINWLLLLCTDCSGIHRSLGVNISKIKSLELDKIHIDYIELLYIIKQSEINQILEEKLNEFKALKPKYNSPRESKEKYIINKYKEKKYIKFPNFNNDNGIIKNIFDNIKINNLINVFRMVKLYNIDLNCIYSYEKEEWGFIHYSVKLEKIFMIKLFYIMGADINMKDKKGLKPIDYICDEQKQIYQYLKDKDK